jgi:hypothetical protein
MAPHTGQSSQLAFDANARSAQFLATVAGSGLIWHALRAALVRKRLRVQRLTGG